MTQNEADQRARRFLASSKQFLAAAIRAEDIKVVDDAFEHSMIPAIACYAFAIELGLKAIYITENKCKVRGHELDVIFNKLSPDSKNAIASAVPVPAYPKYDPPRTFMDVLEAHSKAFEEWRYVCEGKDLVADHDFLSKLAEQAQAVANSLLPVIEDDQLAM